MTKGLMRVVGFLVRVSLLVSFVAITACDDDSDPGAKPEPEVFNFRYLSVDVNAPLEGNNVPEITFHADDLKSYSYKLLSTGSLRINCFSNTFVDTDDELLTQNINNLTYRTDPDVIFDIVDLNGNMRRFTPSSTGATTLLIHGAQSALSEEVRDAYVIDVTKRVNVMPNLVYEVN